ncbi:MAG: BLUF domain-containing protein [Azovibrio sp.]|uniref:BLUF domain-containing protein n=1 Tax=Azovibrio sp. TaxID=1872673 RepID=UPI003C71927C
MGETDLIHLIYCSTATHEMSEVELLELLEESRKRNAELELTGMLLYGGGVFMQVLEGSPAAVTGLYQKIERDPRHHSLFLLEQEAIAGRSFADWSMGFHALKTEEGKRFADAFSLRAPGHGLEGKAIRPGIALELLRQFAQTQR